MNQKCRYATPHCAGDEGADPAPLNRHVEHVRYVSMSVREYVRYVIEPLGYASRAQGSVWMIHGRTRGD